MRRATSRPSSGDTPPVPKSTSSGPLSPVRRSRNGLPSRPTKQKDTRAKKFVGTSVELDAIPADKLRQLVRECIERHVDQEQLKVLKVFEESERELLKAVAKIHAGGAA
jgi:hypothetical protein